MSPPATALRAGILLAAACIATSAVPEARGTSVVRKSFRQLCTEADHIVLGRVTGKESRWADHPGGAIETIVEVAVERSLLGSAPDVLRLRFRGGEVEGTREEVPGLPRLEVGERVVLFVREGRFVSPIVGFSQGVFRVEEEGEAPFVLTAAGQPVTAVSGGQVRAATGASRGMPLEAFLNAIDRELRLAAPR